MSRIFIGGTVSSWRETVMSELTVPYFDPTTPGTFEELYYEKYLYCPYYLSVLTPNMEHMDYFEVISTLTDPKCHTKVILYILTTEDGKTFNENQLKGINDLKARMDGNWYESNDVHHIAKTVSTRDLRKRKCLNKRQERRDFDDTRERLYLSYERCKWLT